MKRDRGTSDFKRTVFSWICSLGLLLAASSPALAASTCSDCHGMPPIDAAYRNITTGGFKGSHQTHQPAVAVPVNCAACHAGSGSYLADHLNGKIDLSSNINNSPLAATYSKGVFFNQTSNPVMGSCSNTNCHFEKVTTVWSGAPLVAPAGCSSCHDNPPSDGNHPGITGAGKKHGDYYGTSTTSCGRCHPDHTAAAKPFAHATSAGKRGLLLRFTTAPNTTGAYSKTANLAYPAYLPSQTTAANRNGSCTAMYCHSDGAGGAPKSAAVWGGTLPADCTGCHGGNSATTVPVTTGLHAQHVNNAALLGTNIACAACHNGTVAAGSDRAVTGLATHADGTKTVAFSGGGTYNATAKSCSATICHAAGKATATQPAAPSWTGAAMGCNGCHGRSNATGTPDYTNGGAATPLANSHAKHAVSAADCDACHTNTTTSGTAIKAGSTIHANGTIEVSFNAAKAGATATWTVATKSCATTYCHGATLTGGTTKSPVWGATLTGCGTCHGFPPATISGVHTGKVATDCITCHPHVNATGTGFTDATKHLNGTIDAAGGHAVPFYAHATPPFTSCAGCHNTSAAGPYPAATAGSAPNCRGCHTAADPTVTATGCTSCHASPPSGTAHPNIVGSHVKHSALVGTPNNCAICHSGAGAGSGVAHGPGNKGTNPAVDNIVFSAAQAGASATWTAATKTCGTTYCHGATLAGGGTTKNPVWGTTLTGCGTCHGDPPATATHAGVTVTQCINCHTHVNATGTGFTNAALHINGVIDAAGGVSSGGSPCYSCHSGYNVMNSSTAYFHHALDDAAPDQAPNAGTYPSSQSVLACTSCHTDHNYFNSNKGANLRTAYNAAAGATNNHDFSTAAPYGLCVSCHSIAQTKSTAQTVAGTTTTIAIDGSATGFQASMHNYTASSLFGASLFSANCVKCHTDEQNKDKQTSAAPDKFGTHYSIQRSLLNPMGATPQAAAGADFCYRCHSKSTDTNPGGGPAKPASLKDYFGSRAMTAASEDIFSTMQLANRHNVSSYKGLHKDDETRAGIAAAKHVECTDCHDPHMAKSGRHTAGSATLAGVLTGVSGVGVTTWGANWTSVAATAYNPSTTTAPLIAATAEWQVCFKCHSGANANVATWGGTGAAAFTDLALEFNPNNASRHPVVSPLPVANQLTAARLTGGWVPGSVMTCSDCHATDSAASKGPHGSSVKWMLAGTNKAWPYTTAAGNGGSTGTLYRIATYNTGAGTKDGLFCLNCHTVRPATGVNNWHSNSNVTGGQHGSNALMACASCHIRVPHGGKVSRLLQTANAPARYRPDGNATAARFTHWGSSTVNIKGSAFSSSYFGCSSQHSSTGGEVW